MSNPPWGNWYSNQQAPPPQGYYPYAVPHAGYQWGQPTWNAPPPPQQSGHPKAASGFKSAKYPTLNPILAADTTLVRFDVAVHPTKSINTTTYVSNRNAPVLVGNSNRIRLVSKAFPWTIELQGQGAPLTCEDLWIALYEALQQHIVDSEWGMIVLGDKKKKEVVEKAMKKRCEKDVDSLYKRIDFLGENTLFKGLEKEEEFVKSRVMKGVENVSETWVIKIA